MKRVLQPTLFVALISLGIASCSQKLGPVSGASSEAKSSDVSQTAVYTAPTLSAPSNLLTTNDRPRDLFAFQNTACYTALKGNVGRKLFCVGSDGSPQAAFDLNPGGNDSISSFLVSENKLYFSYNVPSSNLYQPYYFDGSSAHAIPLPSGIKLYGVTFFPGEATGIYFTGWDESGQKVLFFDGSTTSAVNPSPGSDLDAQKWEPWGSYGGRLYFTISLPSGRVGRYSYKSGENSGQPFEVRTQKGIMTQALLHVPTPFQPSAAYRATSHDFITLEDDDTWRIFSLGGAANPNAVPILGSYGPLSNNLFHRSGLLGVCFNTASGETFCIDRNSNTAVPLLTVSNGTYPQLIDAGASSVYYLKGSHSSGSPRIGWFDGSVHEEIELNSATRQIDEALFASVSGDLLFTAFDTSAEGKSRCPYGTRRMFRFQKSTGQINALTAPQPCMEGSAHFSNPLASQVAVTSSKLFLLEDASPGRPNFGANLGFQMIRHWNGATLETVPSSNQTPYLALPYSNIVSTVSHAYTTLSTPEGLKLYRISRDGTAGDWKKVSDVIPGGSDEILWGGICAVNQGVLFATYHQAQPGGGTGSVSKLWLYNEQTDSTQLIREVQDSWGSRISMSCIKLGSKWLIQLYDGNSTWETHAWDGTQLSKMIPSGDAVTNSSQPLTDLLNTGLSGPYGTGQVIQWSDSAGHSKLYSLSETGATQQISNINPGGNDDLQSFIGMGDRIFLASQDSELSNSNDSFLSVYSLHQGVMTKHNLSIQTVKTVNGEKQKTGLFITLFSAGNTLYALESLDAKYLYSSVKIHFWNGSSFSQLPLPDVKGLYLMSSKADTAYLSGIDSEGKRQLYTLKGSTFKRVDFSASVPDLQLSEPILFHGPGSSVFLLNYQGDEVMRMIRLESP